ncbi:hypothetical protein [Maribellus sediminis]|uniref:hypothetical protein n=1 Tax=Maribellus sediminis TaxID=2696285 RepID=UPI0014320FBB|nr:hypothetical protein [Maribellus sediminis]
MATVINIDYADLVIPISSCPFHDVEADCPFIEFWELTDYFEKLERLNSLSVEKKDVIRMQHQNCMKMKIEKSEATLSNLVLSTKSNL